MKPRSGSASRAATICVTWSSLVKWRAWRLAVSVRPTPGTSMGMSPTDTQPAALRRVVGHEFHHARTAARSHAAISAIKL